MRFPKVCVVLLGVLVALSTSACKQQPVAKLETVSQAGVSLVYNTLHFGGCEILREPRLTHQENQDGVPVDVFPARITFAFKDKRPLPALDKGPRYLFPAVSHVTIIPLSDTTVANFTESYPGFSICAQQLIALLQKRPVVPTRRTEIPDIAEIDCERMIISKVQFVDLPWGQGVFFITQYGQEFHAINNEELVLVFQGLTTDQSFYVSAQFAIGHPTLDRGIDDTKPMPVSWQVKYLDEIQQRLDFFPESSFRPPFTQLKAVLTSFSINPSKVEEK